MVMGETPRSRASRAMVSVPMPSLSTRAKAASARRSRVSSGRRPGPRRGGVAGSADVPGAVVRAGSVASGPAPGSPCSAGAVTPGRDAFAVLRRGGAVGDDLVGSGVDEPLQVGDAFVDRTDRRAVPDVLVGDEAGDVHQLVALEGAVGDLVDAGQHLVVADLLEDGVVPAVGGAERLAVPGILQVGHHPA